MTTAPHESLPRTGAPAASDPPITLIAAVARGGGIGKSGGLLVHLKEDLQHFKRTTIGAPVVMGRRTWESLPPRSRPLPGRRNLVLTRDRDWQADGAERVASLDEALERLRGEPRAFVIGGAEVYAQALPRAQWLVLTEIHADLDADAFFPRVDPAEFEEIAREPQSAENGCRFDFVTYRRRTEAVSGARPASAAPPSQG